MIRKKLYLLIVIAVLFFNLSGLANAAIAPVSTPLGYNTLPGCAPARIATDSIGKLYITDSRNNLVRIYSNNGTPLLTFKVNKPLGIAVDQSGKIFVGSRTDGSVSAFNSEGEFLYKLGSGNKEFGLPSDIAISSSGTVYITDSWQNRVNAYTTAGAPLFSITGLNFPTGIAVDDAASEVYVSDHNSGMVKIFDMKGAYKRYIKGSGTWSSVFVRPQGIALDSTRIYIADAYNSAIVVYGKDGKFLKYMGNYGAGAGEFKTPLDIAIDKDNKIFVTNYNNGRVEVFGIDSYTQLNVSPNTLSFSLFENGLPITQTVNLTSTGSNAGWVASSSNSWVTVSPSAGTAPADANITVNPAGLGAGNYTAQVMFSTVSETSAIVMVNLEVKPNPKTLYVAPTNMSFKYQLESPDLPSGNIVIASTGGSLSWTASPSVPWIGLSSTSGLTPSNIKLRMTDAVNALSPGTYNAKVIIDGGNAQGSPATINVSLRLIYAGTVKVVTNLEQAGFDITPIGIGTSYSGTGTEWSYDEAAPGDYTISFKHISGYLKPPTRTFTVKTGREVTINGEYRTKPVATHIVAGSGGNGNSVVILPLDNTAPTSFTPFASKSGVRVAAGDIDASGVEKIIVTDKARTMKVYTPGGLALASFALPTSYSNIEIAVGDIDNDGRADIIAGAINSYYADRIQREIKLFSYNNGNLKEKDTLYTENNSGEFTITLGDINGDGVLEIIIVDRENIRAFGIDLTSASSKLTQIWSVNQTPLSAATPQVSAGDINDDGISEIALSIETEGEKGQKGQKGKNKSVIKMLKGTGEDYGMAIDAYGDLGYEKPSTVALGDIDGDGKDEILAGAGRDERNEPLIRIFESNGTFTKVTIKAMGGKFGVNVSLGRFK